MNDVMKIFFSFIALLFYTTIAMAQTPDTTVTTQKAYELMQSDTNIVILDVRRLEEFTSESGHLRNAILIPVEKLEERFKELEPYKNKTIIAVCRSGNRSGRAATFLNAQGYTVKNLLGGMLKWNEEQLPVVKEEE